MDSNALYNALRKAFDGKYLGETTKAILSSELKDIGIIKTYNRDTQICHSGMRLGKIHLMLTGKCHAVNFSSDGRSVIADTLEPTQLFGLYEMMSDSWTYNATVTAVTTSLVLEMSAKEFYSAVQGDIRIAMMLLKYLAKMTEHSLSRTNSTLLRNSYENLSVYISDKCKGRTLPYRIMTDRKTIAEELNINLRTLYRYMDKLRKEGYISVERGKIVVNSEQLKALNKIADG